MDLSTVVALFAALVGFPAFVTVLTNALKFFKVLTDTQAPAFVFWVSIVGFVGVAILNFYNMIPLLAQIDSALGSLASIIAIILASIPAMGVARLMHNGVRGLPFVGYSFTLHKARK